MTLEDPKFICDDHCGRLARWLRFVGFDCLHDQQGTDAQLLLKAANDDRVILTRDRHLVSKTLARQAILLNSSEPLIQLQEVLESLSLTLAGNRLLTRCTVCNAPTGIVDATAIWDRIPPYVQRTQTEFRLCRSCDRIYWKGTHVARMLERLWEVGLAS